MHFVVAWETQAQGERWDEINSAMQGGLLGYSWVRLLRTFYVLNVDSEHDWNIVHEQLLGIAAHFSGEVNFLMSPIYYLDSDFFVYEMPDKNFYHS
jgi:hypothetical protein